MFDSLLFLAEIVAVVLVMTWFVRADKGTDKDGNNGLFKIRSDRDG